MILGIIIGMIIWQVIIVITALFTDDEDVIINVGGGIFSIAFTIINNIIRLCRRIKQSFIYIICEFHFSNGKIEEYVILKEMLYKFNRETDNTTAFIKPLSRKSSIKRIMIAKELPWKLNNSVYLREKEDCEFGEFFK